MNERKVFLSSRAAKELRKMGGREQRAASEVIQQLADSDDYSNVRVLNVPGADDPYLVARAGSYRILFRYLPPSDDPEPGNPARRDLMVASIVRRDRMNRMLRWIDSQEDQDDT